VLLLMPQARTEKILQSSAENKRSRSSSSSDSSSSGHWGAGALWLACSGMYGMIPATHSMLLPCHQSMCHEPHRASLHVLLVAARMLHIQLKA
jgi:hypothetical protein